MSDVKGGFEVDGPPRTTAAGVTGAPANTHLRQGEVLFSTARRLPHSHDVTYL